jgi:hypothetical protein
MDLDLILNHSNLEHPPAKRAPTVWTFCCKNATMLLLVAMR